MGPDADLLAILAFAIVCVFLFTVSRVVTEVIKYRSGARESKEAPGFGVSELKTMIRAAVEQGNQPLLERIEELETSVVEIHQAVGARRLSEGDRTSRPLLEEGR
jgi:hypothetical protein